MAHPELAQTKACVFDAYGTLLDVASAAQRCRDQLGGKADALAALWRETQLDYTWLRSLMGRHADFAQVTGEALDYALAALNIGDDKLRARLLALYSELAAYPDAAGCLTALRRAGRPSVILSNGAPAMLQSAVKASGISDLVGSILSVEAVGIYKPHPRVYQLAVDHLALPAAQICFVSSNGWDAAGAAAFGLHAVWANRSGAPRARLPGTLAAEIKSLAELPALLGL